MDYLPTRDDLDAARLIPKHLAKVIRLLPNDAPDRSRASELFSNWKEKRRYDHELIPTIDEAIDPKVCLIGVTDYTFVPNSVGAMVWFWNNPLYPLFTLTLYWNVSPGNLIEFRAFFPYDSYEWDIFLRKKASVMILRKGQIFAALEVEMEKVDPQFWSLIDQAPPKQSVLDRDAARAWVEDQLDRKKSTEQQLECNWAKRLAGEVSVAMRFLNDPAHTERVQKEKEIMLSSPFAKSLEDKAGIAAHFYQAYVNTFFIRNAEQSQHPGPHIVTIRETLSEAPLYAGFIEHLLKCAFFSSVATSCGHEIRSLTLDEMVERVPLDTGVLGRCVEHFWERFSFDPPYYFKELYGAGACPVDIYKFVEEVPLYQGDLEKGEEFVKNLLAEATSLKQWTIPSGAYVQIECGNIKAVKIFELNNEVACVLVDHSGHYLTVWANPSNQQMAVGNQANLSHAAGLEAGKRHRAAKEEKACKDDEEFLPRILMGIKILLACIIRDFWVTEEREKIFGASYLTRKSPRLKPDWAKKVIVYLPRIRYVGDMANRAETLNLVARKPHFVVGHLRKALHASEGQIFLARNYGISVPEGFTFVRPHRRGDQAQEHIYRSRSALRCISALSTSASGGVGKDAWFTYELNVKKWLASNGYEVVYLAGNRNGDGGVDIQAIREDEHLLVQCKYRTTDKIGPDVIRELLGTLQTFPPGAKGVIVTSSELTNGARDLAIKHSIQFIERADFLSGFESKL